MSNENGPAPRVNEGTGPQKIAAAEQVASVVHCRAERAGSAPATLAELNRLLRDRGLTLAEANADRWWKSCAVAGIDHLASTGRPFTADDLRDLGVPDPGHPNHVGAQFMAAARAGIITPCGFAQSRRPSRHANWQRHRLVGVAR